jgi:hypothetical protein
MGNLSMIHSSEYQDGSCSFDSVFRQLDVNESSITPSQLGYK